MRDGAAAGVIHAMNTLGQWVLVAMLLGAAATVCAQQAEETNSPHPRIVEGRAISAQFGSELKAALERAIAADGPASAVAVCRDEAPRIAARMSTHYGVTVARTALKVRNSANAARPWQRTGLEAFEQQLASGAKVEALESFETRADGSAHYLKAITTAPLCTACHGETIAPDVQSALNHYYPRDQATGFRVGDLRGAFSVEWPSGDKSD
jgi:hypothetical protein